MKRPLLQRKLNIATARELARRQYLVPKRNQELENEQFMYQVQAVRPHYLQYVTCLIADGNAGESCSEQVDARPEIYEILDVSDAKRMCSAFGLLE